MLSRSEAGKRIRQYFITAEKELQRVKAPASTQLSTFDVMRIAIDKLENHEGRINALETRLLPGVTMHHSECPADSEIKSRALRRKHNETGISLAICEKIFDLYSDSMWKGETCVNPNPTVRGNKPCRVFKTKEVNAAFKHFLKYVKPIGNGYFTDKDIANKFKVPCLS